MSAHPVHRRAALSTLAASALLATGCPVGTIDTVSSPPVRPDDAKSLAELVRETLAYELKSRTLSTELNGAWQIFHGILAYGDAFEIQTPAGPVSALDYFQEGNECQGFRPQILIDESNRRGLRVDIEPMTKVGQGHRDQWLAVVAQAGLTLDAPWRVGEETLSVEDWLRQALYDVPLNYEGEFSWTLIPLSFYRPTDYEWTARDGGVYSTELLVESETMQDLASSVCGGTHRLIGLAFAVRNRMLEGKPLSGVWAPAKAELDAAIELARVNQNPDGSYSTSYLHRTGWCRDLGEMLGTTGHVLEFLAVAGDDELLSADWVQRSVRKLCGVLNACRGVNLECGVLYHALHGLVEYERRALV